MLVFIYIILVFLILRFSVTLFNFLSNPKLGKYGKHFSDQVSVLIDDSGDSSGLLNLLTSLKQQDYLQIEVVVICRQGSENEKAVRQFCSEDGRFRISSTDQEGNAVSQKHELSAIANGDYLLFLDPNTTIKPGFINSLLYRTKVFDLTLLNIIPGQTPKTFIEHLLLPIHDFVLLNLIPLRLVRLVASPAFSASGDQCLFFSAADYRKYQWHPGREAIKAVKMENLKAETLVGDRLISVSPPARADLWNICGKELLYIFGNNTMAAVLYLVLVVGGPIAMLVYAEYELLILPVGLIFLTRVMISFLVRQNPVINVLLHVLQMITLCLVILHAVFIRILTIFRQ